MSDNIDVDSYIDICKTEEEDSDPITSPEMVRRYFKLRSGVCRMFAQSMRNIQAAADDILRSLETDKIVNFSHAKLEREIKAMRDWDKILADLAQHDGDLCLEIKNSFNNYKDEDKDMVILRNYLKRLTEAKKAFELECERTDVAKEKYHKKAFDAEKTEIKREIAENDDERRKYTEKYEELKKKVENKIGCYQQQRKALVSTGHVLKDESSKYQEAKLKVDQARTSFILERLQTYATKARFKTDAVEDCNFSGLKINDIVKDRQQMECVTIKRIERYRGTQNKEALFRMMREEIEEERRQRQARQDEVRPGPSNANGHVTPEPTSVMEVGNKYLITIAYKKERPNEISLTQGKKITLLMPPNSHGLAFGEKKGRFGRKKKGYFPMSHVVPAD